MNDHNSDAMSCARVCWLLGAALGVLTFIILLWVYDYGGIAALFWGIVIFVAAGWLIGKLFCGDQDSSASAIAQPSPSAASSPVPAPQPEAAPEVEPAPAAKNTEEAMLSAPRDGQKDDLKKISGVGPALEKTLNELGVFHFDQIAAWNADDIAWVDDRLKFKGRIERDDWIGQAKSFADAG